MAKTITQTQQVIDTLRAQDGYSTLGNLYHLVDTSEWTTRGSGDRHMIHLLLMPFSYVLLMEGSMSFLWPSQHPM